MKKSLFAFFSILLFLSCQKSEKIESLIGFIPNDAAVIIQTSNLKQFQLDLNSLPFFEENSLSVIDNIQKDLGFLKYTDSITESIITLSISKEAKFRYTFISKQQPNFELDSIPNKSIENIKVEGLNYQKLSLEGNEFFVSIGNGPFIISSSETQLRQILKKEDLLKNKSFTKAYKAISPNKTSLIINHAKLKSFQQNLFPNLELENVKNYAGWSAVDLEFSKNGFSFNGLSIPDNEKNLHKILAKAGTVSIEFAKIVPENSGGFAALGYQDSEIFLQNLKGFKQDSVKRPEDRIILNTREAGIILAEENSLLAIKTLITTEATDLISGFANLEENYRDFPIYKVTQPDVFKNLFTPFFNPKATNFAAAIDQHLVFSASIPQLRDLIAGYVNKNTLAHQAYYKDSEKNLAEESSILITGKTAQLKSNLAKAVSKEFSAEMENLNFGKHKLAILQLVEEDDFAHIHGSFESQNEQNTSNNKTEEMLSVNLEAELLNEPVFVKNHLNNQMDIAVQDINNTLYLISNKGTIFWKKKLKGQILGEIQQVDLFKNGKFQLAFATPYSIEVLDRNGNTVKPFPLKFKDEITQSLSIFDYDNNRKYRFLITQKNEVFMYDKNGKSVKGFDFRKTNSEILKAPKHLRIQNKDYIVFPEKSGKLNILSRQGEHRVKVKESIDFSENEWYEFENDFLSSNAEGNLVKVTQNGSVNIENTAFSENHSITARPNLLVSLSENILKIKGKELNLDYGLYTNPKIFLVNNKYYISLTDLQTQKVFVFDSNAELLPGFPVYGTSGINLNNADIDQRPEFVVKGGEKEVLMYKL
ncbi:hypothetical protein SAMN05660776_1067 [Salegentibacter holothuriorum]|uniref:Uncharacterized protein n=1 Tax=Salegentibacter holothuriorum TaxID=241145 RepID=A0A1T5BCG9_9FLAO|nr:hypothetical protein [Salegentibacter holothuriorum]SKB44709.1 hypothetical protein SAMN05660776_1067 [Salegentibacter holothuriorum]